MNSADQFFRLFNYDIWANEQILFSLQNHLQFPGADQAVAYYAHIAGSQEVWYHRIDGRSTDNLPSIWPDYDLAAAHQVLNTCSEKWKALIKSNSINRNISYQNSKGTFFETVLSDILHHLVIHGQHHRAQIAALLRQASIEPPQTDFIFFSRSN